MVASEIVNRRCESRWFVRCADCLSVAAVEVVRAGMLCGLCGGRVEEMGRVTRDRRGMVTAAYDAPACDARCTHARGPSCDCPCGGANHGTGVTVPVVVTEGAPRVSMPLEGKARRVAAEWRAELERVRATRAGRMSLAQRDGAWLGGADYSLVMQYRRVLAHAKGLRTHKGRMAQLRRIQESGIAHAPVMDAPMQGALL